MNWLISFIGKLSTFQLGLFSIILAFVIIFLIYFVWHCIYWLVYEFNNENNFDEEWMDYDKWKDN